MQSYMLRQELTVIPATIARVEGAVGPVSSPPAAVTVVAATVVDTVAGIGPAAVAAARSAPMTESPRSERGSRRSTLQPLAVDMPRERRVWM